jgi:Protein of unknown function (DUF3103)
MEMKHKAVGLVLAAAISMAFCTSASASQRFESIDDVKQQGAREVASLLSDRVFRDTLHRQLLQAPRSTSGKAEIAVSLQALLANYRSRTSGDNRADVLRAMDYDARVLKGHSEATDGLLEVRLHLPDGQAMPTDLSGVWVAFEPKGKESSWTTVEAYDSDGRIHHLDARKDPAFPVLIFDIDGAKDLRAGVQAINGVLTRAGAQIRRQTTPLPGELTVLDKIHLKDDNEPWVKGGAEIFAVVSGLQPDLDKPNVQIVDMPYLDWDKQEYTPGQDMIYWADFGLGAANIQLFEQDDNTDYKVLAEGILTGVEAILGVTKPEFSFIPKIAQAIIAATPGAWWLDDNDYVDSYYLIERGQTYVDRPGAADNATATFKPYTVDETR